jgi:integrase
LDLYANTWTDVDWWGRKITVLGKWRIHGTIPISPGIRELLFPLQGNHEEFVLTYIAQKTEDGRVAGQCQPMTREGLKTEWKRSKLDPKLLDYRFHDNRHTAATGKGHREPQCRSEALEAFRRLDHGQVCPRADRQCKGRDGSWRKVPD